MRTDRTWDLVVVGAGPGGSSAARAARAKRAVHAADAVSPSTPPSPPSPPSTSPPLRRLRRLRRLLRPDAHEARDVLHALDLPDADDVLDLRDVSDVGDADAVHEEHDAPTPPRPAACDVLDVLDVDEALAVPDAPAPFPASLTLSLFGTTCRTAALEARRLPAYAWVGQEGGLEKGRVQMRRARSWLARCARAAAPEVPCVGVPDLRTALVLAMAAVAVAACQGDDSRAGGDAADAVEVPDEVATEADTGGDEPPQVVCTTSERWACVDCAVGLAASGSDAEGSVVMRWDVVAAPPGSVAVPAPGDAGDTSFVPDLVGDYRLRFTATDRAAQEASCETAVHAVERLPVVFCPGEIATALVGTPIELEGIAADDGAIVHWLWEAVSGPSGTPAVPSPADAQRTTFRPDVPGPYKLRLTVTDDEDNTAACAFTVAAWPSDGLLVELYWNPPDRSCGPEPAAGCDSTDLDLHLLHPDAPSWFGERDCYYADCNRTFGMMLDWDDLGPPGDPELVWDDVEGYGPELVLVALPVTGHTYRVGVHHYHADTWVGPAQATCACTAATFCRREFSPVDLPGDDPARSIGLLEGGRRDVGLPMLGRAAPRHGQLPLIVSSTDAQASRNSLDPLLLAPSSKQAGEPSMIVRWSSAAGCRRWSDSSTAAATTANASRPRPAAPRRPR